MIAMESNNQEAGRKSPAFLEEIKAQLPADLDARIAEAQPSKGVMSRQSMNLKKAIFNEVADSMQLSLEKLVVRPPENALAQASEINGVVKDVAMKVWGKELYTTQPAYKAWVKVYQRSVARISREEKQEERLKRPLFKELMPVQEQKEDQELKKMMRAQAARQRNENILHEEVRDLLNKREGTSLTPAERVKIQDIERKERELQAMRASQEIQTTQQLRVSAKAGQAEAQALRKEVKDVLAERKGLKVAKQNTTSMEHKDKNERFNTLTSGVRSRLDRFNGKDSLSKNDAHEVMRILDGVEYSARKIWGDHFSKHTLYKKWLADTNEIRAKAEKVLYGDMPELE
jgi:hypothetical protein